MAAPPPFSYSGNIENGNGNGNGNGDYTMNITLGLRAVSLLAFVAAATSVIVEPGLLSAADSILGAHVAVSHP
jgi:hypothetical protein